MAPPALPLVRGVQILAALLPLPLSAAADFDKEILPILSQYCLTCHSTDTQKGDLDLERFSTRELSRKEPAVWEHSLEQIANREMPPKDKPQPSAEQMAKLTGWMEGTLESVARETAGDPGPVVLRRLSNAEYTYTIRDLTGVVSLDPAREFPVDGAAGEGFTNVGASLVMSPALLTKYLDAAKLVAEHAVLLPDGLRFSPSTTRRDWTEEALAEIRGLYGKYTEAGGGTAVNLQGIKFDTNGGGRLPLEKYLAATLQERDALLAGKKTTAEVARERGLSGKYLGLLWQALNDPAPGVLLDSLRAKWKTGTVEIAPALAAEIGVWQQALWQFSSVGHIGKRNGPPGWQLPASPLADRSEMRLKLTAPADGGDAVFYLVAGDAGDGREADFAIWEQARLVAPGRADLPLRDVRGVSAYLLRKRESILSSTARCLKAAAEGGENVPELAVRHGVEPDVLTAWMNYLGLGASGFAKLDTLITEKKESLQGYDFVKGWVGKDALSVIANSSDQAVRVPGNMKPHSIAMHPAPKFNVAAGWRSPLTGTVTIRGTVQHAHPECGNGVSWAVELRRGQARQRLGEGVSQGATEIAVGPFENIAVGTGEAVVLVIGPRDGNHSCDLTAVDLTIAEGTREWSLARDVSPDILAGNPHASGPDNLNVWHFFGEPTEANAAFVAPAGSLLTDWRNAPDAAAQERLAEEVQLLLLKGPAGLAKDSPDELLHRQLTSLNGPLLSAALQSPQIAPADSPYGLDPARFAGLNLAVQAPEVLEIRLPAALAEGAEVVVTGRLDPEKGSEGSVQMQVLATRPTAVEGIAASRLEASNAAGQWSDNNRRYAHSAPVLVQPESAARGRFESAFTQFRDLFPAALCYTKIVPVDEVVTLTLFYREDHHLTRLMLEDAEVARLERLWGEMHFVSQDALTQVDAFEQLWQFATQDADPSAFEPMRAPIQAKAEAFRKLLVEVEPKQVQAVQDFASQAWRRPLTESETAKLRELYATFRGEELSHEAAVRMMLARVMVAPAFLYRGERPPPGSLAAPVNDWELATRLSYFLWSSAPDPALRELAASGKLRDPATLAAQVRRMVRDPWVDRLAREFGCQWLHIRDLDTLDEKSERHFPTFAALRGDMQEEAVRFFADLFQQDGSILSLLNADHTFVNASLAGHYGMENLKGDAWRRVDGVRAAGRGGILGFAGTLARQSGASRTSPILRGNWICEVLLGERLPRPPKDVPVLPEEAPAGLSERQLIEQHSSDPSCAGCHARIDPFGFALEGYDAIGRRREADTQVKLPDGSEFAGLEGLRDYLLAEKRDEFVHQFCRKLLGYALGRGVQLSDHPLLESMEAALAARNYRVGIALEMIVQSPQFGQTRGRDFPANP